MTQLDIRTVIVSHCSRIHHMAHLNFVSLVKRAFARSFQQFGPKMTNDRLLFLALWHMSTRVISSSGCVRSGWDHVYLCRDTSHSVTSILYLILGLIFFGLFRFCSKLACSSVNTSKPFVPSGRKICQKMRLMHNMQNLIWGVHSNSLSYDDEKYRLGFWKWEGSKFSEGRCWGNLRILGTVRLSHWCCWRWHPDYEGESLPVRPHHPPCTSSQSWWCHRQKEDLKTTVEPFNLIGDSSPHPF